jgi:hypothetical protein
VEEFHARDPHVTVKLRAKGKDGQFEEVSIERPNMMRLAQGCAP